MTYLLLIASVVLGYGIAILIRGRRLVSVPLLLAFSGAYLLGVSLLELLPHVYGELGDSAGVFVIIGLLLQIVLDFLSRGAEHGHVHGPNKTSNFPVLLFVGLSFHALIEGIPAANDHDVLLAVVIHKVPIAIILGLYFLRSEYKPWSQWLFFGLFAIMSPIGAWIRLSGEWLEPYSAYAEGIAMGLFLHVSTTILFESSRDHKFNLVKLATILAGFLLAYLL